jgi:hypothetical protein
MHDTLSRPPLTITVDLIGETCRNTFVPEGGRALESPGTVSLYKTTGVVTGSVQATPENRVYPHTVSSMEPPNGWRLSGRLLLVRSSRGLGGGTRVPVQP